MGRNAEALANQIAANRRRGTGTASSTTNGSPIGSSLRPSTARPAAGREPTPADRAAEEYTRFVQQQTWARPADNLAEIAKDKYRGYPTQSQLTEAITGAAYNARDAAAGTAAQLRTDADQFGSMVQDDAAAQQRAAKQKWDDMQRSYIESMNAAPGKARDAITSGWNDALGRADQAAGAANMTSRKLGLGELDSDGRNDARFDYANAQVPEYGQMLDLEAGATGRGFLPDAVTTEMNARQLEQLYAGAADLPAKPSAAELGLADYMDTLGSTTQGNLDIARTDQGTADMIDSTGISDYARAIAQNQYAIDPNLAAGWFDPAMDIKDYGQQRDLASIEQYGMLPGEVTAQQRAAEQQAAAVAEQQTTAQEAELSDLLFQATGMDPSQLAATANLDLTGLTTVVGDPLYESYDAVIRNAITAGDPATVETTLSEVSQMSPETFRVLAAVYGDYLSGSYNPLDPESWNTYEGG